MKNGVNFVNLVEETDDREATSRSTLGRRRSERKSPPPREGSKDGSCRRPLEGSRGTAGSEAYEDHVDARRNDRQSHISESASLLVLFASVLSRVLARSVPRGPSFVTRWRPSGIHRQF